APKPKAKAKEQYTSEDLESLETTRRLNPRLQPDPGPGNFSTRSCTPANGRSASSMKAIVYGAGTRSVLSMCKNCGAHEALTLRPHYGCSPVHPSSTTQGISFRCLTCGTRNDF